MTDDQFKDHWSELADAVGADVPAPQPPEKSAADEAELESPEQLAQEDDLQDDSLPPFAQEADAARDVVEQPDSFELDDEPAPLGDREETNAVVEIEEESISIVESFTLAVPPEEPVGENDSSEKEPQVTSSSDGWSTLAGELGLEATPAPVVEDSLESSESDTTVSFTRQPPKPADPAEEVLSELFSPPEEGFTEPEVAKVVTDDTDATESWDDDVDADDQEGIDFVEVEELFDESEFSDRPPRQKGRRRAKSEAPAPAEDALEDRRPSRKERESRGKAGSSADEGDKESPRRASHSDEEEGDRKRRRRRRRPRKDDSEPTEVKAEAEAAGFGAGIPGVESFEVEEVDSEDASDDGGEERKSSGRRGKRGRRDRDKSGKRRHEKSAHKDDSSDDLDLDDDDDQDTDEFEESDRAERSEKPRRKRSSRSKRSKSEESADHDDDAGDDKKKPRKIPTWDEAINMIIDGNLESRSKSSQSSKRGRGRGRGRG